MNIEEVKNIGKSLGFNWYYHDKNDTIYLKFHEMSDLIHKVRNDHDTDNRKYQIIQKSTGLSFEKFIKTRGLTKAGMPRKTGPMKIESKFSNQIQYKSIEYVNSVVRSAILDQVPDFFNEVDIIAYEYAPVIRNVTIESIRSREEKIILMDKLKGKDVSI